MFKLLRYSIWDSFFFLINIHFRQLIEFTFPLQIFITFQIFLQLCSTQERKNKRGKKRTKTKEHWKSATNTYHLVLNHLRSISAKLRLDHIYIGTAANLVYALILYFWVLKMYFLLSILIAFWKFISPYFLILNCSLCFQAALCYYCYLVNCCKLSIVIESI